VAARLAAMSTIADESDKGDVAYEGYHSQIA
jgi:hypothetical protein